MEKTIRIIVFLTMCIGTRLMLAYISKGLSKQNLKLSSFVAVIVAISFITLYLFDLRKSGIEASNGIVWWNVFRPIHGILFLLYAIYAFKGEKNAYYVLLVDAFFGLFVWLRFQQAF